MTRLALVEQAACDHEWVTDHTMAEANVRLECIHCGYTIVERRALSDLLTFEKERPNPLGLDRHMGSSGVAGPA